MSWKTIKPFLSNKVQSSDRIIPFEIFKRVKERIPFCCKKSQYSMLRRNLLQLIATYYLLLKVYSSFKKSLQIK